jgi:uncharacterized protein YeeX (DUF496 family)
MRSDPSPKRREDIITREIEDQEMILYDPQEGLIHVINATAAYIWSLCDGVSSIHDIVASMKEEYDIQDESIEADVLAAISQLKELKLFEETSEGNALG